jgi:hypothetical protein
MCRKAAGSTSGLRELPIVSHGVDDEALRSRGAVFVVLGSGKLFYEEVRGKEDGSGMNWKMSRGRVGSPSLPFSSLQDVEKEKTVEQ